MKKELKYGGMLGGVFAIVAYVIADLKGFNNSSFLYMIYLYIVLGAVSKINTDHVVEYIESLERFFMVTNEQEKEVRNLGTWEKYKIEGTMKKIGD